MTCTNRDQACDPECPGWAYSLSDEHGYHIERCDECVRFADDVLAEFHVLTCDACRPRAVEQLSAYIAETETEVVA